MRYFSVVWDFVNEEGVHHELSMADMGREYFAAVGCTCRPLPVPELGRVMVAGADDCPVHGFGVSEEGEKVQGEGEQDGDTSKT